MGKPSIFRDQIRKLYERYGSTARVAEEVGCSTTTVRLHVRDMDHVQRVQRIKAMPYAKAKESKP